MNFLLVILAFSISRTVTSSTVPVTLEFLKGITRLNTTGYTDFYFFCSARGQFLLWKLNSERLAGFEVNDEVGQSSVNERPNYVYSITLLSSEPAENDHRTMGSIIVVSFRSSNPSNFEMTCSNGSYSETTMAGPVTEAVNSSVMYDSNRNITLDYISSSAIVRNRHTHIFICGANYSSQVLQANGLRLSFRSAETLGNYRVASASAYTINEQGIFIARNPVPTVSILIVAQDTDVEVICFNGNVQTRLMSNMARDAAMRSTPELITEPGGSATSSPAYREPKTKPIAASTITIAATPEDNVDSRIFTGSSNMNGNLNVVYTVTAISVISAVIILSTTVSLGMIFIWCYRAMKNKVMMKIINMEIHYDYEYSPSVKQENSIGNEEKQASLRDTCSWKETVSNKKMRPSVKLFSRNSFIMLFKPLQVQAEEVREVKPSQIQAIQEGGSQFAGITTGRSMKQVYIKRDGETFESTEKSVVARQDNPSSYWKIMGGMLKGLLSKYYTLMKFDSFKVRRSIVNCDVAQVQEGGSKTAMSSGKLFRPFHIKNDGQTIVPITTTSLIRQTLHQTEDDIFFDNPGEEDQCRRRPNAGR